MYYVLQTYCSINKDRDKTKQYNIWNTLLDKQQKYYRSLYILSNHSFLPTFHSTYLTLNSKPNNVIPIFFPDIVSKLVNREIKILSKMPNE